MTNPKNGPESKPSTPTSDSPNSPKEGCGYGPGNAENAEAPSTKSSESMKDAKEPCSDEVTEQADSIRWVLRSVDIAAELDRITDLEGRCPAKVCEVCADCDNRLKLEIARFARKSVLQGVQEEAELRGDGMVSMPIALEMRRLAHQTQAEEIAHWLHGLEKADIPGGQWDWVAAMVLQKWVLEGD